MEKQDNRASCWSVTINNPTDADYENMEHARQRGWKVEGQLEKGEEGTPHLQLMVRTPQVRFSAVCKMFPRAHVEPARNVAALSTYVHKEKGRVAPIPTGSDSYPSQAKFWYLVAKKMNNNQPHWTMDDKNALRHPDACDPEDGYRPNRAFMYQDAFDRIVGSDPLKYLDIWTEELIAEGYYVECHATNPAVRAAWKKWWRSIVYRAMETARQTDIRVQIPGIPSPDVEYNQLDADDSSRQEATRRVLEGLDQEPEDESNEGSQESCTPDSEGSGDNC